MLEDLESFARLISPVHLWIVFGLASACTALFSFILIYHWQNYGTDKETMIKAQTLFGTVTALLLIGLALTISLFSNLI